MMNIYTFPQLIKMIRNEAGLTQSEFADEIGVSKILISMVESGQKDVSKNLVRKVAERLNVNPMSITPFLFNENTVNTNNMSKIEKGFLNHGTKMQEYLIQNRAKLLKAP